MENLTSDQDKLISTFVEIAVGHSIETAILFLKATNWNLEDAINLFLIHRSNHQALSYENSLEQYHYHSNNSQDEEQIPLPLPSRRDTLYDDPSMCRNTSVPVCPEQIWDSMTPSGPCSKLSSLFRPPIDLLFKAVSQAIKSSFMLLQAYDDTDEGKKVSSFYKIESVPPVVLLIDPFTGQKMRMWSGMIQAHSFVEDLKKYMESGPNQYIASLTSKKRTRTEMVNCLPSNKRLKTEKTSCSPSNYTVQDMYTEESSEDALFVEEEEEEEEEDTCLSSDMFEFLVLTEEPKGDCDRSLVCSLCVRFPDGRRKPRKFLKSEPIQLLWSFCYAHMEESERNKAFKLVQAIPGASKTLEYGTNATFEESGLDKAMISVIWE
ncbi:hypothetical protein AALP_AAs65522U000100 [Arabis alpina]|uniref:UBX domain-containing protein n=1 Tax=Arabis alpina TaxID=50452 RepID=A0A087FXQ6_ARAAL|nr:hypothetical protein AALP_AAs65522U000100 [Arabis alpina]